MMNARPSMPCCTMPFRTSVGWPLRTLSSFKTSRSCHDADAIVRVVVKFSAEVGRRDGRTWGGAGNGNSDTAGVVAPWPQRRASDADRGRLGGRTRDFVAVVDVGHEHPRGTVVDRGHSTAGSDDLAAGTFDPPRGRSGES